MKIPLPPRPAKIFISGNEGRQEGEIMRKSWKKLNKILGTDT